MDAHGISKSFRHYVQLHPVRFDRSIIPTQNLFHHSNVIRDGSPSRIRIVRRISLGITTRPRSSMRRTIPVAFMVFLLRSAAAPHGIFCIVPSVLSAGFGSVFKFSRWFSLAKLEIVPTGKSSITISYRKWVKRWAVTWQPGLFLCFRDTLRRTAPGTRCTRR